jgi:hypothetical protein
MLDALSCGPDTQLPAPTKSSHAENFVLDADELAVAVARVVNP